MSILYRNYLCLLYPKSFLFSKLDIYGFNFFTYSVFTAYFDLLYLWREYLTHTVLNQVAHISSEQSVKGPFFA